MHRETIPLVSLALAALSVITPAVAAAPLGGSTITVDLAADDFIDFGGAQTVADLPGPDGHVTLREAVIAANNTPGAQSIAFAIPTSQWSIFYTDRAIIRLENMLYVSGDDTTLDFSTQAALTGDTNPAGGEVGLMYAGPPASIPCLWLAANRCTVKGLDVSFGNNIGNTIWITGNENRVVGCHTTGLTIRGDYGGGAFNVIGGTNEGDGNTFTGDVGIYSHANDNTLIGNAFRWGLRIAGDTFNGKCERNRIGGPTAAERNRLAGKGYSGEEGYPLGVQLDVSHALDTLIQGNFVGTTDDGMAKYPGMSGTGGIVIGVGSLGTIVRDNVVSGILMVGTNHYQGQRFGTAITVTGAALSTTIAGNRIGVAVDGVTPIPSVLGVSVQSTPNNIPRDVLVGGVAAADANVVAFHETDGVRIGGASTGVSLSRNSIHDNGGLGIDLIGVEGSGVSLNDPLDADTGANRLQNYPLLTLAKPTSVNGTLASAPSQTFAIELFASSVCDSFGFGEGSQFVGSGVVATDATGKGSFSIALTVPVPNGTVITATATDADGNTSEFSACIAVTSGAGLRPIRR